jgi:hypothetical protein
MVRNIYTDGKHDERGLINVPIPRPPRDGLSRPTPHRISEWHTGQIDDDEISFASFTARWWPGDTPRI